MNKLVRRIFVLVALMSCVALVSAQGGGAGAGGGQGRRGGGGFGQGRRGGGNSEMGLTSRADVQKELAITDEQKTKLTELRDKQRQAFGNRGGGNGGGGNGGGGNGGGTFDPAEMQKRMEEARTQQHKDLAAILNETQMKRLGELLLQREGNGALARAEVQKALGFTADQTQKVKDLQQKERDAQQGIREKTRNQEMTPEEAQAARAKNTKTMNEELAKILTAEQAAKFKEMQGKEFKFEDNNGGR